MRSSLEGSSLFSMVRADGAHHWREARQILEGDPWLTATVPWKGPGYSYFLAGLMTLFGRSPGALRWPLALLGALNCAALVLLARRVLPTRWSAVAGLLAAANGVLILFDGELLQPTLLIALNLPVLALLSRPAPGARTFAAAGFLLGIVAIVHPLFLLPTALLAIWVARRSARSAAAFTLAAALAIAPVTLTNFFVRGQPVLISWNGGINLYVGNQPNFDQYSGNRTQAWSRVMQSPVDAGIEQEHERDRLYYALAVRQLVRHPVRSALTLLEKAVVALSPVEYASNIRLYELREHSPVLAATLGHGGILWWPFGVVGPLILVGAVFAWRQRKPLDVALALWSLGLVASMVLFFVNARYRAPLVFFGSIPAAQALAGIVGAWRAGVRVRAAKAIGACACLVALLAAIAVPQRGYPLPMEWDQASVLAEAGSHDTAEQWLDRALDRAGDDPALRFAAAAFYADQNERDREREQLERMLAMPDLEPDLVHLGHEALARSYLSERRFDAALIEVEDARAVRIDFAEWHGYPHFGLGLGPMADCWLRLLAGEIDARAGNVARARKRLVGVRTECGEHGRFGPRLLDVEVLCARGGPNRTTTPQSP